MRVAWLGQWTEWMPWQQVESGGAVVGGSRGGGSGGGTVVAVGGGSVGLLAVLCLPPPPLSLLSSPPLSSPPLSSPPLSSPLPSTSRYPLAHSPTQSLTHSTHSHLTPDQRLCTASALSHVGSPAHDCSPVRYVRVRLVHSIIFRACLVVCAPQSVVVCPVMPHTECVPRARQLDECPAVDRAE